MCLQFLKSRRRSHSCVCASKFKDARFQFSFYKFRYQLTKYNLLSPDKRIQTEGGKEKIQQIAHGMYFWSPNYGLATTIYLHLIRRMFHSLTGTCYSKYAPTAPSKMYKSQASERQIPIPFLHFSPFSSPPSFAPSRTPRYCGLLCQCCPRHRTLSYAGYDQVSLSTVFLTMSILTTRK